MFVFKKLSFILYVQQDWDEELNYFRELITQTGIYLGSGLWNRIKDTKLDVLYIEVVNTEWLCLRRIGIILHYGMNLDAIYRISR